MSVAPDPAHDPLAEAVASALARRVRLPGGARVLVAVSGGADSVALLRALAGLAPRRGWGLRLAVGHVHHGLRPEAEEEARFVAGLAAELELPALERRLVWSAGEAKENREAAARRKRYAALEAMAREWRAGWIATAHHARDQLETVLLRFLRGATARGLRGLAWRRRIAPESELRLIRPMLAVSGDEPRRFLRALGASWREDPTNADTSRRRAALRHELIPALERLAPESPRRAVALADHMRDLAALLAREGNRLASRATREDDGAIRLDRAAARGAPRAALKETLRRLATEAGAPADRIGARPLAAMARAIRDPHGGRRRFELAGGVTVVVEAEAVRVVPPRGR